MTTTVQRMNERLDRLDDIMKYCQLSRTAYPVETKQPLPAQSDSIFNECEMNGHELSDCSPSHNISTCGANQFINSIPRDSFYFPEEQEWNVSQCIPNSSYPWKILIHNSRYVV